MLPAWEVTMRKANNWLLALLICVGTASAQERLVHSASGNTETWRIDEPDVKRAETTYPSILFQKGDRFTIDAGGCAQTGGFGKTWKRFVDPSGPNSDHLYHGLILVPSAIEGIQRVQGVLHRVFQIGDVAGPVQLTLGYEDDNYNDNGYWGHDDGTEDQCNGVGPAWVVVTIVHCSTDRILDAHNVFPGSDARSVDRSRFPLETLAAHVVVSRVRLLQSPNDADRGLGTATAKPANQSAVTPRLRLMGTNPPRLSGRISAGTVSVGFQANEAVQFQSADSQLTACIALDYATEARAETANGYLVYRGGYGHAVDIIQRLTDDGIENYLIFTKAPPTSEVTYSLWIDPRVAGLRLISNGLELLDADGVPRIRMAPPHLVDSAGNATIANVSLTGCAVDTNPVPPWGRTTTNPGARTCSVHVIWPNLTIQFPALLNPSWSTTKSLATRRDRHSMVLVPGPGELVIGGVFDGASRRTSELYSPIWSAWTFTGYMQVSRYRHTTTLLADGRVLVTGGSYSNSPYALQASAELYDPATGSWTKTGDMKYARSGHSASLLSDGRVLVAGGAEEVRGGESRSTEIWTPKTGQWTSSGPLNVGRAEHSGTVLADGRILVAGGYTPSPYSPVRSSELFDPRSGKWTVGGDPQFTAPSIDAQINKQHARESGSSDFADRSVASPRGETGSGLSTDGGFSFTQGRFAKLNSFSWPVRSTASLLPDGRLLVVGGRLKGRPIGQVILLYESPLSTDRNDYVVGEPIQALFSFTTGAPSDYVSIVFDGANPAVEDSRLLTNGDPSGSLTFAVMRAGTYRARFYRSFPETRLLAESTPFVVRPMTRATISTSKAIYARGEKATITFAGMTGRLSESIGIARAGTSLVGNPVIRRYTMGTQSGRIVFSNLPSGTYVAYAYLFDRLSVRARSATFIVKN
jgi:hypothetical protein